ncbi:MAG: carboxylating nicotinate-nucleotide diphosphorylase [Vicinamibacterales bacterium]
MKVAPFGPLDPSLYRETVRRALAEDLGWGDVTTEATVAHDARARGVLLAKAACVVAGLDVALEAFRQLDPGVQVRVVRHDGESCAAGDVIAELEGQAQSLLTAERVALNFLQRLSGVATLTRAFVDAVGQTITILDTRKTTPLMRTLEKHAVRAGGGTNHRASLDESVLIKDNHVRLAGSVTEALRRARSQQPDLPIEIEVQSFDELDEALREGATRILADNFSDADLLDVVRRTRGRATVEVSGGVTLDRVRAIARSGAEYVSIGALTHSAGSVDISFEIEPLPA